MPKEYLFKSDRLGFRNWINSDIDKMRLMYSVRGYCYFAVEQLKDESFIGFIGLCYQDYESPVTPNIDIGWRLNKKCWNNGFATEGAKKCLEYGFNMIKLRNIISTTPKVNVKSIRVMEKIGMSKLTEFKHPRIKSDNKLSDFVCYEIINLN